MVENELFEICNKIEMGDTKLIHKHRKEIREVAKNYLAGTVNLGDTIKFFSGVFLGTEDLHKHTPECEVCGTRFVKKQLNATRCSSCVANKIKKCQKHNILTPRTTSCPQCSIEDSHIKYTEENKDLWIECPLCGFRGQELSSHIMKHHKMTPDEFKKITGMVSIKAQHLCDKVKGCNNPGYQHGGKFSVFSEKFIYADEVNIDEMVKKAAQSRKDNGTEVTSMEYWLKKTDGDVELARKKLSERQTTFSLEKCIDKFGVEKGYKIWKARQEKWLNTLNSKSTEEIDAINRKKSTKVNYRTLWNNSLDVPGMFYVIQINESLIKIGITTREFIHERYKDIGKYEVLVQYKSTINHCFQIEQLLRRTFNHKLISKSEKYAEFGWTETFKDLDAQDILNELTKYEDSSNTQQIFNENFKE